MAAALEHLGRRPPRPTARGPLRRRGGRFQGEDVLGGRPIDVRFVWDRITDRGARWTQLFAWAGSDEWEANWTMDFERVSSDAAAASTTPLDLG